MKTSYLIILTILITSFSSCSCDCEDDCEKSIQFKLQGFEPNESSKIMIYKLQKDSSVIIDSLEMIRSTDGTFNPNTCNYSWNSTKDTSFTLSEDDIFTGDAYHNFDYRVKVTESQIFLISDIIIQGSEAGSFWCKCYNLTELTTKVDNETFDLLNDSNRYATIKKK